MKAENPSLSEETAEEKAFFRQATRTQQVISGEWEPDLSAVDSDDTEAIRIIRAQKIIEYVSEGGDRNTCFMLLFILTELSSSFYTQDEIIATDDDFEKQARSKDAVRIRDAALIFRYFIDFVYADVSELQVTDSEISVGTRLNLRAHFEKKLELLESQLDN